MCGFGSSLGFSPSMIHRSIETRSCQTPSIKVFPWFCLPTIAPGGSVLVGKPLVFYTPWMCLPTIAPGGSVLVGKPLVFYIPWMCLPTIVPGAFCSHRSIETRSCQTPSKNYIFVYPWICLPAIAPGCLCSRRSIETRNCQTPSMCKNIMDVLTDHRARGSLGSLGSNLLLY
jgi:hypothetical protein